jgi:hypothetical protein
MAVITVYDRTLFIAAKAYSSSMEYVNLVALPNDSLLPTGISPCPTIHGYGRRTIFRRKLDPLPFL